jgi:hypothetical protein
MADYDHDKEEVLDEIEEEPIEGYCVSCKTKVDMEEPLAVWTSRGRPGTRGKCPVCGQTVFRMGRTHLHGNAKPPSAVQVIAPKAKGLAAKAAYIAVDATHTEFAEKLGQDLQQIGINVWVDDGADADTTQWSGGVHPALDQCTHLVIVLTNFTAKTQSIEDAWTYFMSKRKPIAVARVEAVDPPDNLRSRPRFDFTEDYKTAFRGLVEVLSR